jgi:hypothetical protein
MTKVLENQQAGSLQAVKEIPSMKTFRPSRNESLSSKENMRERHIYCGYRAGPRSTILMIC